MNGSIPPSRYRSPDEFTEQGLVLQGTVQHTVANPVSCSARVRTVSAVVCIRRTVLSHDFLMERNYPYGVGALLCQVCERPDATGRQGTIEPAGDRPLVTVVDIARGMTVE